jgi:threonine/homoserine/homoserine lactone efflux protein
MPTNSCLMSSSYCNAEHLPKDIITFYWNHIHSIFIRALIFGVTLAIALGGWLVWTAIRPTPPSSGVTKTPTETQQRRTPLLTTYVLTMANTLTVIAFLAFIGQLPSDASIATSATAARGLFLGSLCIQVVLASGCAALGRLAPGQRSIQFFNVVSGVGIIFFDVTGLLG